MVSDNLLNIMTKYISSLVFLFAFCVLNGQQNIIKVSDLNSLHNAVAEAEPGATIIMANGTWTDVEIAFRANGKKDKLITLKAEDKGKVFIEGQSNLRMAGEYLVVEGLVFRNGYTPRSEVISMKYNKKELCNNCRITECVIDKFNNPERFESDYWVGIYGKNNRFDHNHLTGKGNQGVTLAVRLTTKESQENHNLIDHNYFGPRAILGSNGGETLRIGTSHHSLTNSNTIVEYNYFDRCNGEHEIISNKSCQNIFRYNTFFECQGTLTMRHGNETLVENNYFFGNGKANTGGIRIINESQRVENNYCEGLTGHRFRGAFVIMNGVPNSPLNRYFQVLNSSASNNSFINCDFIQLCAGSDEERSATPQSTSMTNNLIYNENKSDVFTVYDDVSGITFKDNILSENIECFQKKGFKKKKIEFERVDGLLQPKSKKIKAGRSGDAKRATLEDSGVDWYSKKSSNVAFGSGKQIKVRSNESLVDAVKNSNGGDVILLTDDVYTIEKSLNISHPLTVMSMNPQKTKIYFQRSSLFNIENGGALRLSGLVIHGEESPDKPGNTVVRTSRYSMVDNYKLIIDNCDFKNLDVNHSFHVLKVYKNTFADSLKVTNSTFTNITGNAFALNKEYEDLGIYNVEDVVIENCKFKDIQGSAIDLYRGGGDESTFGPILYLQDSQFDNVGKGKRNKSKSAVHIHGVQYAEFESNLFENSKPLNMHLSVGEPVIKLMDNVFSNSGEVISNSDAYLDKNTKIK